MANPLKRALGTVLGKALDPTIVLSYDRTGYRAHALRFVPGDLDVDMSGRHCAVTGANSGLGFETAKALAERGAPTYLLCRNLERGEAARDTIRGETGNPNVHVVLVDLSKLSSVAAALPKLRELGISVLVNNAGVLPDERSLTPDGLELTFATNVVGHHRLMAGLIPHMARPGRIINVSSGGMYSQRLNLKKLQGQMSPFDGVEAYAQTKRAMVILTEMWGDKLKAEGITVNAMHPGWADTPAVRSSLPRFYALTKAILRTPAEGADTAVWLAICPRMEGETGGFYFDRERRRTHYLPTTKERPRDRELLWALMQKNARLSP